MKPDWQNLPIGAICDVVNGGTPKTGVASYWDGDHQWITPAEMGKLSSPYVSETERTLTDLGLANSSARLLPPYSVILSSRAPIGHLVINTEPMATNQGCKGLIPGKAINSKFLYYYLGSIVDLLNDLGTGTTFKELSGGKLKEVTIPVPPVLEQQRIVSLLDDAFGSIAIAKANAERNIQNAQAVFGSHLQSIFGQRATDWVDTTLENVLAVQPQNGWSPPAANHAAAGTPVLTLSSVTGFQFRPDKVKYTSASADPRRHYWVNNGDLLITRSNTPELVGHVAIAAGINGPTIYPDLIMRMNPSPDRAMTEFLYYQLRSPALRREITGRAQGANPTMKKISNGAVRTLPVAIPPLDTQRKIVAKLGALELETRRLVSLYKRKLGALETLQRALLHQAFSGELTQPSKESVEVSFPTKLAGITATDLHAGILAMAFRAHEANGSLNHFGHVKAEKIAHMVEAHLGIDLGRAPVKDAAGPNDYPRLMRVEHRARKAGFFRFHKEEGGYRITKLGQFGKLVEQTRLKLGDRSKDVDALLELTLSMSAQQAEIMATVYAAWNNLLLDGRDATDEQIVLEARENWHAAKLRIPRDRFFAAVEWMRKENIIPRGRGKRVLAKA